MTHIEAMKLALEALEWKEAQTAYPSQFLKKAITALRQAIEQAEQAQPVGEVLNEQGEVDWISFVPAVGTSLYTAPPPRQPLTDEQISDLWCKVSNTDFVTADTHEFARAIEAAHGIKGEA